MHFDMPTLAERRELLRQRILEAVWHPVRPIKVFRLHADMWITAARYAGDITVAGFPTFTEALAAAETVADIIRAENPCARA